MSSYRCNNKYRGTLTFADFCPFPPPIIAKDLLGVSPPTPVRRSSLGRRPPCWPLLQPPPARVAAQGTKARVTHSGCFAATPTLQPT